MKYKLKETPISENSFSFVDDYLRTLGINSPSRFIGKPSLEDEESPWHLDNIQAGIELLQKHIQKKSQIFLVVDSDADGYTSSAIIYNFIKEIEPDIVIDFYVHEGKEHGILPNTVPYGTSLAIIPDAGSNQTDDLRELVDRNIEVLVLDHHIVDEFINDPSVVIINNQTSENFKNKELSGAGVTFKFCQAYHEVTGCGDPDKYYDLAAIGIVSDMMWAGELDNNYIIKRGLSNIYNRMIKAFLEKQSYSIGGRTTNPNMIDISFYITPLINGVVRSGTQESKENLFKALADNSIDDILIYNGRKGDREETYYDKIARDCANIKNKQKRETDPAMESVEEQLINEGRIDDKILIAIISEDDIPKTLTGLVSMKITAKHGKPSLIMRPVTENKKITHYRGSGRGLNGNTDFPSLKDFLEESNLCEYARGHNNALGVSIPYENLQAFIDYSNEKLKDVNFEEPEIEVDYVFDNEINKNMLSAFADCQSIYGGGIQKPLFAFTFLAPFSSFKVMGEKATSLKITYKDVDFVKFKCADIIKQLVNPSMYIRVTLIGEPSWNEYNGRKKLQIMIDEIELEETKPLDFF